MLIMGIRPLTVICKVEATRKPCQLTASSSHPSRFPQPLTPNCQPGSHAALHKTNSGAFPLKVLKGSTREEKISKTRPAAAACWTSSRVSKEQPDAKIRLVGRKRFGRVTG
ncbi:hypothetical protein BDV11DRAFT_83807 [Aspergillus similis]